MTKISPDDKIKARRFLVWTFTEAYLKLGSLQAPDRFAAWLRSIARNRCLSYLRSQPVQISYREEAHGDSIDIWLLETPYSPGRLPNPEEILEQRELSQTLEAALQSLPEKSRTATTLHYFEEMSYQEIADTLRVSIATIEGRLYRARRQLREEIRKMTSQKPELDATAVQQMIDSATQEMHEQIAGLQKQLRVSHQQEQSLRRHQVFAASETITRLPNDAEDPISWGVVGAYRLADGHRSARTSIQSNTDIDGYLDLVPDAEIARMAALLSDPTAVAILKQLVKGDCPLAELTERCQLSSEEIQSALDALTAADLVARKEDDLLTNKDQATAIILTLVPLISEYLKQLNPEKES